MTTLGKLLGLFLRGKGRGGGGGGIRNSDVINLNFLSNIIFFFIRFKASPNIHANDSKAGCSSSLRVSHRGSRVAVPPPHCLPQL